MPADTFLPPRGSSRARTTPAGPNTPAVRWRPALLPLRGAPLSARWYPPACEPATVWHGSPVHQPPTVNSLRPALLKHAASERRRYPPSSVQARMPPRGETRRTDLKDLESNSNRTACVNYQPTRRCVNEGVTPGHNNLPPSRSASTASSVFTARSEKSTRNRSGNDWFWSSSCSRSDDTCTIARGQLSHEQSRAQEASRGGHKTQKP